MIPGLVDVFLGLWMMISPIAIMSTSMASWNSWIVGVFGILNAVRLEREHRTWQSALSIIASSCIFVGGFIPRFQYGDGFIARSLIFGGLLLVAGVSSFGRRPEVTRAAPRM